MLHKNIKAYLVGMLLSSVISVHAQDIRFTGNVAFSTLPPGETEMAHALVVDVEVEVSKSGRYSVGGLLLKGDSLIANSADAKGEQLSVADFNGNPGIHSVSIRFSGEQIFRSQQDGPYEVQLQARGVNSGATSKVLTPAYKHSQFGETGVVITRLSEQAIGKDEKGKIDFLQVGVEAIGRGGGSYLLQGTLSKQGYIITSMQETVSIRMGTNDIKLRFPGRIIRREGIDGPYDINVTIQQAATQGSLKTRSYSADDFSALLELDNRFIDEGIDGRGRGVFDLLRIQFGADVKQEGRFQLEATLRDSSSGKAVYISSVNYLARGAQLIKLDFPGSSIRANGMNGPYQVEVRIKDTQTREEVDHFILDQKTKVYRAEQFVK